jgi:hypothetical protein
VSHPKSQLQGFTIPHSNRPINAWEFCETRHIFCQNMGTYHHKGAYIDYAALTVLLRVRIMRKIQCHGGMRKDFLTYATHTTPIKRKWMAACDARRHHHRRRHNPHAAAFAPGQTAQNTAQQGAALATSWKVVRTPSWERILTKRAPIRPTTAAPRRIHRST